MSNDKNVNIYDRLWKLQTAICKMIMDSRLDPGEVARVFQAIKDKTMKFGVIYLERLFENETIIFCGDEVVVYRQVSDGTLRQMLESLGENRHRWKSRYEVEDYAHKNPYRLGECANFFQLADKTVVELGIAPKGPWSNIRSFDDKQLRVKEAENRFFIKQ